MLALIRKVYNHSFSIEIAMAIKKIKCKDCGNEFEFEVTGKFSRKYCDPCSKKRKKDYDNLYNVKFEDCDDE